MGVPIPHRSHLDWITFDCANAEEEKKAKARREQAMRLIFAQTGDFAFV
jgi:hypothetical protein